MRSSTGDHSSQNSKTVGFISELWMVSTVEQSVLVPWVMLVVLRLWSWVVAVPRWVPRCCQGSWCSQQWQCSRPPASANWRLGFPLRRTSCQGRRHRRMICAKRNILWWNGNLQLEMCHIINWDVPYHELRWQRVCMHEQACPCMSALCRQIYVYLHVCKHRNDVCIGMCK